MSSKRYPDIFKIEAIRHVTDRGHSLALVADRLVITTYSLYAWLKKFGPDSQQHQAKADDQAEIRRLQKELKRATEERDIQKKPRRTSPVSPLRYAFIKEHSEQWATHWLCSILDVHPRDFYAWQRQLKSGRAIEDERLSGLIKQLWLESGAVYGYRKIHIDLRECGERCSPNRVHHLMKGAEIRAQVGYRKLRYKPGNVHRATPNILQRQFSPEEPNESCLTDIPHTCSQEGWLYLAVVMDFFSRQITGWSMQSTITKDLALDALLMAVWRHKPRCRVIVHSHQGSQYNSHDLCSFLKNHGQEGSMSRRGNCHYNAVAESLFQLLKSERVKKKIYTNRDAAKADTFDYIEMFYNTRRRHSSDELLSPVEYKRGHQERLGSV
ncbi:MAG: IS3 family transposase [Pseudomonadota bacterium]|nr:IS3 family transposase [Pseudomonadota bacterium]